MLSRLMHAVHAQVPLATATLVRHTWAAVCICSDGLATGGGGGGRIKSLCRAADDYQTPTGAAVECPAMAAASLPMQRAQPSGSY